MPGAGGGRRDRGHGEKDEGRADHRGEVHGPARPPAFLRVVVHQPPSDGGLELSPKVVQERLGHSSITMTMDVYGHLFPSTDDAEALAAAERAFSRPRRDINATWRR